MNMPVQPKGISKAPSKCELMFNKVREESRAAFIGYSPFGFPTMDDSIDIFTTMVDNGVDAVEIGLPYSDPVMDGPVIQAACDIAIANGEKIAQVFRAVEAVANTGACALIMSYWNLIMHYGVERFARDFANAGGAGLITPDLIPDEAGEWIEVSDRYGLDRIFLVAPDTTDERLERISSQTRGFVYAASTMGVTGERASLSSRPEHLVQRTRKAGASRVCVGIGVSTSEQAKTVSSYADGVIVGSALVKTILHDDLHGVREKNDALARLAKTCTQLAQGIRN